MAVARARLFSNRSMREVAETTGVSKARVVQANTILGYAPDLADAVLAGDLALRLRRLLDHRDLGESVVADADSLGDT